MMLLPCPVCGCDQWTVYDVVHRDKPGLDFCECDRCEFICPAHQWNQLSRTKWVKVSERLPEDDYRQVQYAENVLGDEESGFAMWLPGDGEWIGYDGQRFQPHEILAWLDNLPPVPEIEVDL